MLRSSVAHLPLSSLASSSRRPLYRTIYAQAPSVLGVLHPRQRHAAPIHSPSAPVLPGRRHVLANRTGIYGTYIRAFHATPRREGWPLIGAMLLSVFKVCFVGVWHGIRRPHTWSVLRRHRDRTNGWPSHSVALHDRIDGQLQNTQVAQALASRTGPGESGCVTAIAAT
jgi:hypothetical protein